MVRSFKIYCILLVSCSEILSVQSYQNRLPTTWNRLGAAVGHKSLDISNLPSRAAKDESLADAALPTFKSLHKMLPALILSGLICGICDLTPLSK